MSETWTDNYNLTSSNKQQNFRTTVGWGSNTLINGPTTRGSIGGQAGLTYDTANPSQGLQFFPNIAASMQQGLGPRLTLSATEAYTRNDQPAQSNSLGLNNQRQTFSSNTASLSADWLLDLVATQGYLWNSYFTSNNTTTVANTLGANASMEIGPVHTARVGYEFTASNTTGTGADTSSVGATTGFTTTQTLYGALSRKTGHYSTVGVSSSYTLLSQDNARIWNVSLFTAYGAPPGLSLSASLGYSFLGADSQSTTGSITTNSTLTYTFTQAIISVSFFQDYRNTGNTGQNFGVVKTSGASGSFLYTFTPLVTGSMGASYTANDFSGIGNSGATPNSNVLTVTAGLRWQILYWLSSSLGYTYTVNNSGNTSTTGSGGTTQTGNYTQNQVSLSVVGSF